MPTKPVCGSDVCTAGVTCGEVIEASTQADLDAAASVAGACVAVLPGSYGDVTLAAGTSLLGRWADEVTVGRVTVGAGSGAVVRGVETAGIVVQGATAARLDQVRVASPAGRGIDVAPGSSVDFVQVEVANAPEHSILAIEPAGVTLDRVFVHDGGGPGIWVQGGDGCNGGALAPVSLQDIYVQRTTSVGVAMLSADVAIDGAEILSTAQGSGSADGYGLATGGCTKIAAEGTRIDDAAGFGAVLFETSGTLGAPGEDRGIIIINGRSGGLWMENPSDALQLENFDISDSGGVGIGVGPEAIGIIIINGRVGNTTNAMRPVAGGGQQQIGDGLLWGTSAQISVDGLTLEGSARNAVLIDGEVAAGSSIANVTLKGGDASKGILQQGVMEGAMAPDVGDNAPTVSSSETADFEVPLSPAALSVE